MGSAALSWALAGRVRTSSRRKRFVRIAGEAGLCRGSSGRGGEPGSGGCGGHWGRLFMQQAGLLGFTRLAVLEGAFNELDRCSMLKDFSGRISRDINMRFKKK